MSDHGMCDCPACVRLISLEGATTPGPGLTWLPDPNAPEGFFGVDRSAPNRLTEPTPEGMGPFVDEEDLAASVQELAAKVAQLTAMHDAVCRELDQARADGEATARAYLKDTAELRALVARCHAQVRTEQENAARIRDERDELQAEVVKLRPLVGAVRPLLSAVVRLVRDWPAPSVLVRGMTEERARAFANNHGQAITDGYARVCDALGTVEAK
jgi:hypothetical protein